MVRKEGQENGVGIWEINGINKIADRIRSRIDSFGYEFELKTIYVMGSFGSGMGVPQKSDIDIAVSGGFMAYYLHQNYRIFNINLQDTL